MGEGGFGVLQELDVENISVYIADDQFWGLQLREGALYLLAGLILTSGALVIIRSLSRRRPVVPTAR